MNGVTYEFRKHAGRCRQKAESATQMSDRAFWLLLAENWQKLAEDFETSKQVLEQRFKSAIRLQ